MRYSEQEENGIIIKIIVKELNENTVPGMFWGQMKRMRAQGITNHQIRIGLELMISSVGLNKRSGLKHVPEYIGEAIRLEQSPKDNDIKTKTKKVVRVPLKTDFKYRNSKLKNWSE
jgi:hypothetical protein